LLAIWDLLSIALCWMWTSFSWKRGTAMREFRSFWQDEAGAEMVEWAVVTVVLLAATAVVLVQIGDALKAAFQTILNELQLPP
jgi:Flp pilus assembly pilin Flp